MESSELVTTDWSLKTLYASTLFDVALTGMQSFMWLWMATDLPVIKKASRGVRILYLAVSFLLLGLTTASAVINSLSISRVLFEGVVLRDVYAELLVYRELMWHLSIIAVDSILLYRCYIVWFDQKWVLGLPFLLQLGNVGVGVTSMVALFNGPMDTNRSRRLQVATIMIPVIMHIIITLLICLRLFYTHRQVVKAISSPSNRPKNPFARFMCVLVESAAPFSIFGIATGVAFMLPPSAQGSKIRMVVEIPFRFLMPFSLQLIIFKVTMGWSWADKSETSALISQEINFAEFEAHIRIRTVEEIVNDR
ncbi:hypothetical protein BKA70DRAFT_1435453 [Coprinopsis sp. MPI-PUGE-AT-0042]|nr:hypothetical protein BKA70DRAFT_1435453 [Coprinopsis sp. MPI-PUGE-AT-0042]